jgi:hypothetical protein
MSLGVTVIADGKSLVQTTLRLHQSIKFRNFSFFYPLQQRRSIIQNSSRINLLTVLLIGTKKDEGRANRQCGCRSREAAP